MGRRLVILFLFISPTASLCSAEQTRKLKYREYFDKAYGGWLGRISRLTLGVPKEFTVLWPPPQVDYFAEVPDHFSDLRGTAEVSAATIKEGKQAVKMTRLSCHRFRSNEVRLWLSLIA
jgi:hypothetical protein